MIARDPKWIARAREVLDAMERRPPSAKELAPFRSKNWIDKGQGWLRLKPVACLALLILLAGCAGIGDPGVAARMDRHQIIDSLTQIEKRLERDPQGPIHMTRPRLYHDFFGGH